MQFIVKDGPDGGRTVAGVDWQFNAWGSLEGGLYASWERDDAVAGTILQARLYGYPSCLQALALLFFSLGGCKAYTSLRCRFRLGLGAASRAISCQLGALAS